MLLYLIVGGLLCTGYWCYGASNLTDENNNHDDVEINVNATNPYNIINTGVQMDNLTNVGIQMDNITNVNIQMDNLSANIQMDNITNAGIIMDNITDADIQMGNIIYTDIQRDNITSANMQMYNMKNADIQMLLYANNSQTKIRVFPNDIRNDNNSNQNEIVGSTTIERDISNNPYCPKAIEDICARIADMRMVPCGDGTFIHLEQLCNGVFDCSVKTDEINCNQRVYEQVQLADEILLDTANLSECLPRNEDGHLFSDDFILWRKGVNMQLVCYSTNWKEVSTLITSMLNSFESHLCLPIEHFDIITDDFYKLEADLDNLIDDYEIKNELNWSPTSCTCNRQFCKSDYCDGRCRRICWQVYTLEHWGCQSVMGATSISLDFICDGKIDCIDETDEISCMKESSTYKHKADTIYDKLLKILTSKSLLQKYESNKTEKLTETVRQLQNLTIKSLNPDIDAIKTLRNNYFALLVGIFKDLWSTLSSVREINYAHDHLLSLNVKMVKALKHSYTGNKYIVLSAQCSCKNGTCASAGCSHQCNKFCFAEPILTKYSCDADNTYLDINAVCNSEKQCLNGEDEKDCRREECRARHLDKLRINIQQAETLLKDSVFKTPDLIFPGDWKVKIAQILEIATNEDPDRKMLEEKVHQVLHELVLVYSSVAASGKSRDLEIQGFTKASNIIKQTLKTCRK